MSQPEFIDNQKGNTLVQALGSRIDYLVELLQNPPSISIATGYFNPEGFLKLSKALRKTRGVRLLLGAEPLPASKYPERRLGEPRGEQYERKLTAELLHETEFKLKRDRDRLPFSGECRDAIGELLEFLESGKIEVRKYDKHFLHGKAFLFSDGQGVIAGSSNFTSAGLTRNLELNLGQYQPSVVSQVEQWFENLWEDAVPYNLAEIYEARFAEYPPYLVYLRVLWERYKAELEAEAEETGRIRLTRFQSDGVFRAKRILDKYHGVLVADSVGLGKTFIAAELFTDIIERNRQRALLIAPAQLRDGMWRRFKERYQSGIEVVSYEQMTEDKQLGIGSGSALGSDIDDYSLIVIDEAHAFRNPSTKRAQALRRLLIGDPPKKVVMLTATPVNNSLWDLYDLLAYFIGHDAVFANMGIPSLKKLFKHASNEDPFTLKPDVLFDVLDATTVRRTRHFVKKYYPNDSFQLPDNTQVTISFPTPVVQSRTYDLDDLIPGFFDEFSEALAPEEGAPKLTMARYCPSMYGLDDHPSANEAALTGLISSGLLKRFESSSRAFECTLSKMVQAHDDFCRALDHGYFIGSEILSQLGSTDSDEDWEDLVSAGLQVNQSDVDTEKLRQDVQSDKLILENLRDKIRTVSMGSDPKLKLLAKELVRIAHSAEEDGLSEQDTRNRRKVLIFSYFADTVEWIAKFLENELESNRALASYRGRLAVVRGTESYQGVSRSEAVFHFVPESSDAPPSRSEDLFDILVTTDVLAEGMNLQQCGRIINYDLPWNPMRLVQRHGRVDRIGSPHKEVELICIFPDKQLDKMLALEERIRYKLAQAAASIGLDQVVIPGIQSTQHVFADEKAEIEALRREDPSLFEKGGEKTHAHSGEEYRQELRKGMDRWASDIRELPWGIGSGLKGFDKTGFLFCAKVFDHVFLRFVPDSDNEAIESDTLACLSIISCTESTERVLPEAARTRAFSAWEKARDDIYNEWMYSTDPANLQPEVRPLFRAAASHVRRYHPPSMSIEELNRLTNTLEAPWGIRQEKCLREVYTPETAEGSKSSQRIAEVVKELGMQPWIAPEPLDPIDKDEINVVVWMAVV